MLAESPDQQAMFAWFQHDPAYQADFAATAALAPDVHTLDQWLASRSAAD